MPILAISGFFFGLPASGKRKTAFLLDTNSSVINIKTTLKNHPPGVSRARLPASPLYCARQWHPWDG
jgi:hypothetical protein